ncbi:MAG TPA: DEAD/DEAH box helicase family protein, partial [Thermoanaerobaculales bacterium]|nr:DEAD/DEAH box helicase family protein [Thermoanaerobaculales bacterium]
MVNAMAEQKTPEQEARELIDAQLAESGWVVQSRDGINLSAGQGVAIREFPLKSGHGFADYLLFIDGQAVGVLEAKKVGFPLTGVEVQAQRYSEGLPDHLDAPYRPLPFCYLSTGAVTMFSNGFDPHPRSRRIFQFHRPTTLAEWLRMDTLDAWVRSTLPDGGFFTGADDTKPSSLRSRLQTLPPLQPSFLYPNQIKAVTNLDQSLKEDRPRALIQMATGSGKTIMAVTAIYRLIKFGGARRVLFLVDRGNLGEQAEKEFANFRSPDDNRKFTELYNVQRLASNNIGASSKVVISTIQRLYSMLKGEEELDPTAEETSLFELEAAVPKEPLPVVYNPAIPPEHFDVIVVDECHRSIYSLWRQVLEYFDAYLIGLTATPAKHTFGFFNQNLVMEYGHEE